MCCVYRSSRADMQRRQAVSWEMHLAQGRPPYLGERREWLSGRLGAPWLSIASSTTGYLDWPSKHPKKATIPSASPPSLSSSASQLLCSRLSSWRALGLFPTAGCDTSVSAPKRQRSPVVISSSCDRQETRLLPASPLEGLLFIASLGPFPRLLFHLPPWPSSPLPPRTASPMAWTAPPGSRRGSSR